MDGPTRQRFLAALRAGVDIDTAALSVGVAPIDLHAELRADDGFREAVTVTRQVAAEEAQRQVQGWRG